MHICDHATGNDLLHFRYHGFVSRHADATLYEKAAQERLEAEIRRDWPAARIEFFHRRKYRGRTGLDHEIDVSAEVELAQMKLLLVAECRNHKNPLHKRDVMAFSECIDDIGAHKGLVVAPSGFQAGAVEYARSKGIALFSMNAGSSASSWEVLVPLGALLGFGVALWKELRDGTIPPDVAEQPPAQDNPASAAADATAAEPSEAVRLVARRPGRIKPADTFHNRLRKERQEVLGLTAQQFVEFGKSELDISFSAKTISRLEQGQGSFARTTYTRLLHIVNAGRKKIKALPPVEMSDIFPDLEERLKDLPVQRGDRPISRSDRQSD